MRLFGKLTKLGIHTIMSPLDVVEDVIKLPSIALGESKSKIANKARKISEDLEEIEDEIDDL